MKIYSASISPKGLELAAEITDGVLPIWMSPEKYNVHRRRGEGRPRERAARLADQFDVAPFVTCVMGHDIEKCRMPVKAQHGALYRRDGRAQQEFLQRLCHSPRLSGGAEEIQDLSLGGKKNEAMAAIPDKLIDEVALVGPKERIIDRLKAWKASPVKTMLIGTGSIDTVRVLAEACA